MAHDEYITDFDQTIRTQHQRNSSAKPVLENSDIPEVLHVLAKGGMATIFEAKQNVPPRVVEDGESRRPRQLQLGRRAHVGL